MNDLALNIEDSFLKSRGIQASIAKVNGQELLHTVILAKTLESIIEREAKSHEAPFSKDNFGNVIAAVKANRVQAYLLVLKNDSSNIPQVAGGTIVLPTVYSKWNQTKSTLEHFPALYFEDTYVDGLASRDFRHQTTSQKYSRGLGLGTFFLSSILRYSINEPAATEFFGFPSTCYVGEHATGNIPIQKIYEKLQATMETSPGGKVLQFNDMPKLPLSAATTVELEHLGRAGDDGTTIHKHLFAISYTPEDKDTKIAASFTQSLSTFLGTPVIRCQITSHGNLPSTPNIQKALSAVLRSGVEEICRRKWTDYGPEGAGIEAVFKSLRIHALREPEIVRALRTMGATNRMLGPHPTQPVVIDYENIPKEVLGTVYSRRTPFETISSLKTVPAIPCETIRNLGVTGGLAALIS